MRKKLLLVGLGMVVFAGGAQANLYRSGNGVAEPVGFRLHLEIGRQGVRVKRYKHPRHHSNGSIHHPRGARKHSYSRHKHGPVYRPIPRTRHGYTHAYRYPRGHRRRFLR